MRERERERERVRWTNIKGKEENVLCFIKWNLEIKQKKNEWEIK